MDSTRFVDPKSLPQNLCLSAPMPPRRFVAHSSLLRRLGCQGMAIRVLDHEGYFSWCPIVDGQFQLPERYEDSNQVYVENGKVRVALSGKLYYRDEPMPLVRNEWRRQ